MPGQVVASVVWGGENRDILFVSTGILIYQCCLYRFEIFNPFMILYSLKSTGDVPRDFYSGTNLSSDILTKNSGKIYAITGLNVTGVRQRLVCPKKTTCNCKTKCNCKGECTCKK